MRLFLAGAAISVIMACSLFLIPGTGYCAEGQNKMMLEEFKQAAGDQVDSRLLETLSATIDSVYKKYKFSDADIESLGGEAVKLVTLIADYGEKQGTSTANLATAQKGVKDFFTYLGGFMGRYKITGEDVLALGRDVTAVVMSFQKSSDPPAKGPSGEDMQKIFARLMTFSRSHAILAQDLVPIVENLSDMGLSVIDKRAKAQTEKTGDPATDYGVSKEQVTGLVTALMNFQKKYKIDLAELLVLANDIRQSLK
ncbi:MAG: hypothetical protein RDV48_16460 [Candidatus Eremiobacteraeota bacterium]|nr:hypothetical protein [Candidatus Eremiobacteraeota bacterium]